ncbi:hypothetical protein GQ44DRAFT_317276 [Phaeosphaeriaceae sp. PMI808]|nr:hypothetical protein GQ44DRAFT_125949 [Phaeosphaeriaceae sp. PMI808]KAH8723311.1 hypothetical protein GQ44DRAFT_317276 [Phaeosphaeriaceae sp. PMI808]
MGPLLQRATTILASHVRSGSGNVLLIPLHPYRRNTPSLVRMCPVRAGRPTCNCWQPSRQSPLIDASDNYAVEDANASQVKLWDQLAVAFEHL